LHPVFGTRLAENIRAPGTTLDENETTLSDNGPITSARNRISREQLQRHAGGQELIVQLPSAVRRQMTGQKRADFLWLGTEHLGQQLDVVAIAHEARFQPVQVGCQYLSDSVGIDRLLADPERLSWAWFKKCCFWVTPEIARAALVPHVTDSAVNEVTRGHVDLHSLVVDSVEPSNR